MNNLNFYNLKSFLIRIFLSVPKILRINYAKKSWTIQSFTHQTLLKNSNIQAQNSREMKKIHDFSRNNVRKFDISTQD
jgi:hypothetical protein